MTSMSTDPSRPSSRSVQAIQFAHGVVRGSRRHLLTSVLLCGGLVAWGVHLGSDPASRVLMCAIGAALLLYNLLRIRSARRALASTELAQRFVLAQRRSHLLRGTTFLVLTPMLLVFVWINVLMLGDASGELIVTLAVISAGLAGAMIWWSRALRRVRRWHV